MTVILLVGLTLGGIAARREQLRREGAVRLAALHLQLATEGRTVAERATVEYEHGIAKQALPDLDAAIQRAERAVEVAEDANDAPAAQRAGIELKRARDHKAAVESQFRMDLAGLRAEVQKARTDEATRKADLVRARAQAKIWWR
jgi:hypothetical protein